MTEILAALSLANAELALSIDRQARPERGWTLANWARRVQPDIDAARERRDAVAVEYRLAVVALRRALVGRQ